MSKAILVRNEEQNVSRKSYWVYRNIEQTLGRLARRTGRDLKDGFSLDDGRDAQGTTAYASLDTVVSIGLTAHERLADVIRTSLIYLDPHDADRNAAPRATDTMMRLASCRGRGRSASRTVFLGRRGRQAVALLPASNSRHYDLPPLDLSALPQRTGGIPRLTIINHLTDGQLARSIAHRFLDSTDFFVECVGLGDDCLAGARHNRVRCLSDAEVGDAAASVHIHIGAHAHQSDRLRVCDSWQSKVPVLFFDVRDDRPATTPLVETHNEHDVLVCRSFAHASAFLALLLDTPALRRLLTINGRSSAAPAAAAWESIAQDLAA